MNRTICAQALRFAIVGALNTVVGLTVIFGAMALLGLGDLPANALGYAVGLTVSFVGNRSWTFRDRGPWGPSLLRFLLVFAGAYVLNLLMLFYVRDGLHVNSYFAQVAGVIAYTISFFFGSRSLAFRKPAPPAS